VVLDEDKRWNRRTNTCFIYGERSLLKTINVVKLYKTRNRVCVEAISLQIIKYNGNITAHLQMKPCCEGTFKHFECKMFYPADLLCQNTKCTSSGVMLKNTR